MKLNFFSNLKLINKLALILIIPFSAFLFISGSIIVEKYQIQNTMQLIKTKTEIVSDINKFIHMI